MRVAVASEYKRTLILGGTGFIGSNLVAAMLEGGCAIRVFGRRPREGAEPRVYKSDNPLIDYFFGDFTSEHDLSLALEGCDACVHLVTTTVPGTSNQDVIHDVETNLLGTLRLFELMVKLGTKRFVYASSGGTVYGPAVFTPITEDHPTNPSSSYGITKLTVEKFIDLYRTLHGLPGIALRVSNPYGPGQRIRNGQGAIGVFLAKAINRETIDIWGDGSVVRDYLYVGDVVSAITAALSIPSVSGVYNIGSGIGISLNQIVGHIGDLLGEKPKVNYLPGRSFDVSKSILEISRAQTALSWTPQVELAAGLFQTVDWMRKNMTAEGSQMSVLKP